MNLAKRAGLYTIRQKQKSILLFLILVLVSTLVLTGIAIGGAVNDTFTDMHRDIAGRINLERNLPILDHGALLDAMADGGGRDRMAAGNRTLAQLLNGGDFVTFDTLGAVMAVPGVNGYNITAEFTMRDVRSQNFEFLNDNEVAMVNMYGIAEQTNFVQIHSATNTELMVGFVNGNLRLVSGRHITAGDYRKVMISDELAEHNNIHIDDTLKISGAPTFMGDGIPSTDFEFEVVGIFSGTRAAELHEMPGHVLDTRNLDSDALIIDMATLMEEYERSNFFGTGAVGSLPGLLSILVENPIYINNVYAHIANLSEVYGKNFSLTMGTEGFEGVLSALGSLQGLVQTLLLIIALVSMAILAILLTIWTRGRVKEVGIYLAGGIKKQEILAQFTLEAVIIAVIAFLLSLPISHVTAHGAGDYIISQFATAQQLRNERLEGSAPVNVTQGGIVIIMPETGFMKDANLESTLDLVDVAVRPMDLTQVYMIGLPVVICSVLIASYTVVKLKPKEILSRMS